MNELTVKERTIQVYVRSDETNLFCCTNHEIYMCIYARSKESFDQQPLQEYSPIQPKRGKEKRTAKRQAKKHEHQTNGDKKIRKWKGRANNS